MRNLLLALFLPALVLPAFVPGATSAPDLAKIELPGVHAHDLPIGVDETPLIGRLPHCSTDEHHIQVIAVRAVDMADDSATRIPTLRRWVQEANALVHEASLRSGGDVDLDVACTPGRAVDVRYVETPTPMAATTYLTLWSDLLAMGFNDPRVKYVVDYPHQAFHYGSGIAWPTPASDDSPGVDNKNNGNSVPMFAMEWGTGPHMLLHELAHIMGAVQHSAPHATGRWHCYDLGDVMCYGDGSASPYFWACGGPEVFDCNNDDYFHASPPPGSYLATHWNLGSRANRYVVHHDVYDPRISCDRALAGTPTTCTVSARKDDAAMLIYDVEWESGVRTVVAAPQGTSRSLQHTFRETGDFPVRFTARMGGWSASADTFAHVVADLTPPDVTILRPAPGTVHEGCTPLVGTFADLFTSRDAPPLFVDRGCLELDVQDPDGLKSVDVVLNGDALGSSPTGPWLYDFDVSPGEQVIGIRAEDAYGNVAFVAVSAYALV